MKITGIICCLALLCTACSEEKTELPWGSDNYIVSFSLTTGADTYPAVIRDGRITVSIPYNVSLEGAQVSYELCEHASIYPDPATVADWNQEWQFLVSSYDNQNDRTYLYTVERTDIATDGSLTLRTQAEVDAFARSGINTVEGNLTIGGEDEENPVTNLDGLKNLVSVRCDLTITAAYTGETLAGLENLTACESLRIGSAAHPNETLRQLSLPALKEIKGDLCVYGTALQTADFLLLILGEYLCHNTIHADLTPNRFCGLCIVAGQHDHLNAHAGQFRYGLLAGGLDYICHGNDSNKLAITGKEQRCFPVNGHFLTQLKEFAAIDAVCRHQSAVSGKARFVSNLPHKALTGNLLETVHRKEGKVCFFGLRHNRVRQRMLGHFFQRSGDLQQLLLWNALFAEHICHYGRALSNCAGLIQHNRINAMGRFQGLRRFNQDTVACALAGSDHNGRRRCKAQRTGTGLSLIHI